MKKILALIFALVLCLSMFVACSSDGESSSSSSSSSGGGNGAPQTPFPAIEAVLDNLEGAGYPISRAGEMMREMVMATLKEDLPTLEGELDEMIDAVKDEETDYLHILVFELESDAEKYYAVVLPEFEQDAAENSDILFGRDGKIVFEGTTAAVAAAKQ